MPAVALKDGASIVSCTDGVQGSVCATDDGTPIKWHWDTGSLFTSDAGSDTIVIDGYGVVCYGDAMAAHPYGSPCTPSPINHSPELNTIIGSPNVFIGGKLVARVGDKYNSDAFDHTIISGSSTVFIG